MTSDDELLALAEKACGEHASCQCNELSGDELSEGKTCESCHADYVFHRVATIDRVKQLIQEKQEAEVKVDSLKELNKSLDYGDSELWKIASMLFPKSQGWVVEAVTAEVKRIMDRADVAEARLAEAERLLREMIDAEIICNTTGRCNQDASLMGAGKAFLAGGEES